MISWWKPYLLNKTLHILSAAPLPDFVLLADWKYFENPQCILLVDIGD